MRKSPDMEGLQARLGLQLSPDILAMALTHASVNQEPGKRMPTNVRLAFLGDAVIELAVRDKLYEDKAQARIGALSMEADKVVRNQRLAECARSIQLQGYLDLGKGAETERERESILATALEALVGAVFHEKGFEQAARTTLAILNP